MSGRIEAKLRCPRDGRELARVVATGEGRFLEVRGGRVGAIAESRAMLDRLRGGRLGPLVALMRAGHMRVHQTRRRLVPEAPAWVGSSMPETDEAASALWPGQKCSTACPRCHCVVRLDVSASGEVRVVLPSRP